MPSKICKAKEGMVNTTIVATSVFAPLREIEMVNTSIAGTSVFQSDKQRKRGQGIIAEIQKVYIPSTKSSGFQTPQRISLCKMLII